MKDGFQDLMYNDENDERVKQAHLSAGRKADSMVGDTGKHISNDYTAYRKEKRSVSGYLNQDGSQ